MTRDSHLEQIYSPTEHAILAYWIETTPPDYARDIDIWQEADGPDDRSITLKRSAWGGLNERAVSNAVARIVVEGIQNRLPQWGRITSDGNVTFGRDYTPGSRRSIHLLPQFLFAIDWASSGPGISWPEAYHLAYLPFYNRYVVTASFDDTQSYGYTDLAIGHVDGDQDLIEGSKAVILDEWRGALYGWEQRHWEFFWESGLISVETAYEWAREVWEPEEEDSDEC